MKDVLSYEIFNQEFALEVDYIEIVEDMLDITPVPNSKGFVEGVINLRGRIVPVVDISKILNMKLPADHKFQDILILKIDEEEIGIFVDEVKNVLTIDENKLEIFNSNNQNDIYSGKVKGVIKLNNRLIVYLDIKSIFNFGNK